MERYISSYEREKAEAYNNLLTAELLEQANNMVTGFMKNYTEDKEREARIFSDSFSIDCRTKYDYRAYKFRINNGVLCYVGMEGDFRN